MDHDNASSRNRERARRMRSRIQRSSDRFWRPSDFSAPESTTLHILSALTRNGDLRRVRKGLYWRGTSTPLGMSPPPPAALLNELIGPSGVGPSGLSAANLLHLSTQVPRKGHFSVPCRPPKDLPMLELTGRPGQTLRRDVKLTAREVALLEVLGDPSSSELSAAQYWQVLRDEIRSDRVRPDRLARASKTENAPTRARLSSLLDSVGFTDLARAIPPVDRRVRQRALVGAA